MNCGNFYAERDRRTIPYGVPAPWLLTPVGFAVDDAAARTRPGQVLTLALVNMLVRLHRRVVIAVPDAPLLARPLVPAGGLHEAIQRTARAIDPCGTLDFVAARDLPEASVGVGAGTHVPGAAYLGADGLSAVLDRVPEGVEPSGRTVLGAALAACLGSATLLALATGATMRPVTTSLAEIGTGDGADGASSRLLRPIDVGDVLCVGAGAVTSALFYWLREIGVIGRWLVVDGDMAELHNTNRCLGMLAADTGWPGGAAQPKARIAARLIGAEAEVAWYDEWLGTTAWRPRLVLPLANERGVRRAIAARGEPRLIHATTSPDWTAELHRHVSGVDDCIVCRIPDREGPAAFACSTAPLRTDAGTSADAALPFLSGAAGLLLAYALSHADGGWTRESRNHWRLFLGPPGATPGRWKANRWAPREGCLHVPSPGPGA